MVRTLQGKVCCGTCSGSQQVPRTVAGEAERVGRARMEHWRLLSSVFEGCNHSCEVSAWLAVDVHVGNYGVEAFRDVGSSGDHDLGG